MGPTKIVGVNIKKSIIVGIDPGITTGIAVMDTDGEVLAVKSWRSAKIGEIIKFIMKYGRPLVVASDVRPAPKGIEKIARSLGCKLYTPEFELSAMEKSQLTKHWMKKHWGKKYAQAAGAAETKQILQIKNSHENDAFAATIKAYNAYQKIFGKVGHAIEKSGLRQAFDDVAKSVLFRRTSSVREGVMEWLKKSGAKSAARKRK